MKTNLIKILLVVFSIIGVMDAGYVSFETLSGRVPMCRPPFACGKVLESQWAFIAGIPVSVYGLIFYLTMLILSIIYFLDIKSKILLLNNPQQKIKFISTLGFAFSLYLITLMAFVIKAWCLWCLISATTAILLFVITRLITKPKLSSSVKENSPI